MNNPMELTDTQVEILRAKAEEGGQLNDLQKIIQNEFGKNITYMETRFLASDLNITIKDDAPPATTDDDTPSVEDPLSAEPHNGAVQVSVDQVTRPGAMANGSVTWSDGVTSQWVLDQMGRLGLESADETYQPSPEDIEQFQMQLREAIGG